MRKKQTLKCKWTIRFTSPVQILMVRNFTLRGFSFCLFLLRTHLTFSLRYVATCIITEGTLVSSCFSMRPSGTQNKELTLSIPDKISLSKWIACMQKNSFLDLEHQHFKSDSWCIVTNYHIICSFLCYFSVIRSKKKWRWWICLNYRPYCSSSQEKVSADFPHYSPQRVEKEMIKLWDHG